METETQFKRQIIAFLHDPPCKFIDIRNHEIIARSLLLNLFGEKWDTMSRVPDWEASAGDRICLPKRIYGDETQFSHPFSGKKYIIEKLGELEKNTQNAQKQSLAEEANFQENLFLLWRFWKKNLLKTNADCSLWPADTRLPNHSIWNHINVTAAFSRCEKRDPNGILMHEASLLSMQFGPVQEWIETARSTKDCWSGSHILSRIVAAALKAVSDYYGPTAIISPDLCGQPLYDLEEYKILQKFNRWDETEAGENPQALKIASIPHKFLAIIPHTEGTQIAKLAKEAAYQKWEELAATAWEFWEEKGIPSEEKPEWDRQIKSWLQCSWQLTPIPKEFANKAIDPILQEFKENDPQKAKAPEAEYQFAMAIPDELADTRNYRNKFLGFTEGKPTYKLDLTSDGKKRITATAGTWEAILQKHEGELASRRTIRPLIENSTEWKEDRDHLDGKNPIIAKDIQKQLQKKGNYLKENDLFYGAPNLVKRAYPTLFEQELKEKGIPHPEFKIPDTAKIAGDKGYIAVLAMDGDNMGKWASGEKNPTWGENLPEAVQIKLKEVSSDPEYQKALKTLLTNRQSLRPSQMIQFSETLKNFSVKTVQKIVEEHQGTLIYAGGDDVLAFLPAEKAIDCASEIQEIFRKDFLIEENNNFTRKEIHILPGSKMHMSAGICIAHCNEPLQTSIRMARQALHIAKDIKGETGATAVELNKHSGEKLQWRCTTDEKPNIMFQKLLEIDPPKGLIKKICQFLAPYIQDQKGTLQNPEMQDILIDETKRAIQQSKLDENHQIDKDKKEKLKEILTQHLTTISKRKSSTLDDYLGPLLTIDFIQRKNP